MVTCENLTKGSSRGSNGKERLVEDETKGDSDGITSVTDWLCQFIILSPMGVAIFA